MITQYEAVSDNETRVYAQCDLDGTEDSMVIPMSIDNFRSAFVRWHNGSLIQNAFPNLNPDEREFLFTGITPEKWKQLFG